MMVSFLLQTIQLLAGTELQKIVAAKNSCGTLQFNQNTPTAKTPWPFFALINTGLFFSHQQNDIEGGLRFQSVL